MCLGFCTCQPESSYCRSEAEVSSVMSGDWQRAGECLRAEGCKGCVTTADRFELWP